MAKRKLEAVTPESVDELTDEQVAELQEEMRTDAPETEEQVEQAAAPEASEQEQKPEGDKPADQEEAAEQEAKAEGEEEEQQSEKAETVDFKRYDYERNRRRDAEKKAEADRAEWSRRFDELLKTQAKPEPVQAEQEEDKAPDPDEDPHGAIAWVTRKFEELEQSKKQETEEQAAARKEQEEWANFTAYMDNEYAKEIEADPAVKQAFEYAEASYASEMKTLGATPQQIEQGIFEYRRNFAAQWANGPRNHNVPLGQFIRDIASTRGWSHKPAEAENKDEATQQIQVQDTAETERKARSLSNGGGSPGVSDGLTPEQLLEMSEEEFDAIVKKYGSLSGALTAQ